MFQCKRNCVGVVSGAIVLALVSTGCGATLVSGDSASSLLDMLADLGVSEDTTLGELLDPVTVGDVIAGLSEVTESADESAEASAVGVPPDGSGGPDAPWPPASQLDLTDEQQAAADEVFQSERDDVDALRAAAEEDVRVLLTEEQLAIYDELPALANAGGGRGGPGPMGPGGPGESAGSPVDRLADELGLTEEQVAAVDEILAQLQEAIGARHEQAAEEFRSLLTDEPLAELDWSAEADSDQ